jgi:T-complex protein 1 subunit theta
VLPVSTQSDFLLSLSLKCTHSLTVWFCSVEVREIGGRKVTVFDQVQEEDTSVATLLIRSSTENVINDLERALDDGIYAVKTLFTDPRLLPGAGATELELSKQLKSFADLDTGLDQYAIRKFAEAFEVVPRTLVENSGMDPTNGMFMLHQSHVAPDTASMGFNIEDCEALDASKAGIYDLYATKVNALRLAVDAAITVLKVDQIVMSKPAGGPKPRSGPNDPDN